MNLTDFIIGSNNIEGEESYHMEQERAVYEWFLEKPLTEESMKKFHKRLYGVRLCTFANPGQYRDAPVFIGGREAMEALRVPAAMKKLFESGCDPYEFHIEFERIHPFFDLNGRVGRAMWLHQDRRNTLTFLHAWYYQSLSHYKP